MSFYDPIRPRQDIRRNLPILDFRLPIFDWSVIGLLYLLEPEH